METLNKLYKKYCEPGYKNYEKVTKNITLIDNFFKNFEQARHFFNNRDKWKCIKYQLNSKPGYQSIFPSWIGRSLLEKFILDNKLIDDMSSYKTVCNFFYDEHLDVWSISNSNYYPHVDFIKTDNRLKYICLINLNLVSVSTKFYTYKNKEYCDDQIFDEWTKHTENVQKNLLEYYEKKIISRNECKNFLEKKQDLNVELTKTIKYKPNQAIIYPANLFHSPNITLEFTEDNPRTILRTSFFTEVKEFEKKLMYS